MDKIERLRALEKKWRDESESGFDSEGTLSHSWTMQAMRECADELATLIAELGQEVGAVVTALEVFRIAGGDTECSPNPTAKLALDTLKDLRACYDETLTSPAHTSEASDADVSAALLVVNEAANRERHAGNYTQANELVRARVTLYQAAEGRDANADANRLDWLASQFRTCTVRMNGQNPHSPNHKAREVLVGPTFRDAIDAAMRQEGGNG